MPHTTPGEVLYKIDNKIDNYDQIYQKLRNYIQSPAALDRIKKMIGGKIGL